MAIELSPAQLLCFCSVFRSERNPPKRGGGEERGRSEGRKEGRKRGRSNAAVVVVLVFVRI